MKAIIKDNTVFFQDGTAFLAPEGWDQPVFDVECNYDNKVKLVAPGFGGNPYGNGAIYTLKDRIHILSN
jgi:hypothetical protein